MYTPEQWLCLSLVNGITGRYLIRLSEKMPDVAAALFQLSAKELTNIGWSSNQIKQRFNPSLGAMSCASQWLESNDSGHLVSLSEDSYPALLATISTPPLILFVQGNLAAVKHRQMAIVGTRGPSIYGRKITSELATELVAREWAITSGLALGVDGVAHTAAVAAKGITLAVLGSGLDNIYPRRHQTLAQQIMEQQGCLISEFFPNTPPLGHNFPRRNRIISGMSWGTLVTEAALKSGSLISAKYALEQNRDVFAVPGNINNNNMRGCHWLLKQGANLVESVDDIEEQYYFDQSYHKQRIKNVAVKKTTNNCRSSDKVLYSIEYEVTPIDVIVQRTKISVDDLLPQLVNYELNGKIAAVPGGYIKVEE